MSSQTSVFPLSDPSPRRLQGGRVRSLEFALIFICVLSGIVGAVVISVGAAETESFVAVVQFVALFWVWIAAGVCAWWRRPTNGIGGLLLIGGLSILFVSTGALDTPLFNLINAVFASSPLAVTVHLLLAFPSGRVRGRLSVVAVVLGYVTSIVFDTARALALPTIANILFPLGADPILILWLQGVLLAGIPIAFLLGVLLGGFTRTTPLEALSEWLAIRGASRPAVARALATTLGDSTLRVAYWDATANRFVDENGVDVPDVRSDPARGWLHVRVDDDLVGAIDYDARMIAEPWPVRRAAGVLAIAMDRERVTAQLLRSNEALLLSRVRIVEAADRERFRIARDLHDGLQMQLVLLAIEAQNIANLPAEASTAAPAEKLRRGIDVAAADLRRLVHDVLPAALLEQGFIAATEDLVDRLPVPTTFRADVDESKIPQATAHTAYFILAEALSNVVKHARASSVQVRVMQGSERLLLEVDDDGVGGARMESGTGLRGLADRVDALRGSIDIRSDGGRGTSVRVELPCGS